MASRRILYLILAITGLNANENSPKKLNPTKSEQEETRSLHAKAYALYAQGKELEALQYYKKILAIDPYMKNALHGAAHIHKNAGHFSSALSYYNRLLMVDPEHTDARQGRSHALLGIGNYEQAWQDFEHRWTRPRPDSKAFASYMHENNNNLQNKTVLIESEFGFGDTLQFVRYAELLKNCGARVVAAVQKQLVPILSLCPYLDEVVSVAEKKPVYQLKTVLMSLPWAFKTTLKTVPRKTPYLYANKELIQSWTEKLKTDTNFKIGICWHGNAYTTPHLKRLVDAKSIPLALLAPITQLEGVSVYSLQKTSGLAELEALGKNCTIRTLGDDFDNTSGPFMDTAAVMKNLDLVITIDTSIAHLAGGLGVPTWLLLPNGADWRWLSDRDDSPWYPTMKLFRQPKAGDWESVINTVKQELQKTYVTKETTTNQNQTPPPKINKKIISFSDSSTKKNPDINTLYKHGCEHSKKGNLKEALTYFKQICHTHTSCTPVLHNIAVCYRKLGELENADIFYKKALALEPSHPDATFGLALVRHTLGDVKQGWELFNLWRKNIDSLPKNPAELAGKKVLIKAEWGLGDMFNYIRYAENIKNLGAQVFVQAHKPLTQILSGCPYIDKVIPLGQPLPLTDYQLPLLYLPTLFKTTEKTIPCLIPYLFANEQLATYWQDKLHHVKNIKVGICWDMGHYDTNLAGWKRAIPLGFWHDILRTKNISFYCLQKDPGSALEKLPADITVHQFGSEFDSINGGFMDSAAVMKNLDLVITVDTAIAHLAGALGVPAWIILPYHNDYRWMRDRIDTPWYPTVQLFRANAPDYWVDVILKVQKALEELER